MNIPLNPCNIMQTQPLFGLSAERAQKTVYCTPFLNKGLELTGREGKSSKVGTFEECESFLPFFQIAESNKCDLCTNLKKYTYKRRRSARNGVSCALLFVFERKWGLRAKNSLDIPTVWSASYREGCSVDSPEIDLKQMTASAVTQKDKEN